MKQEVCPQTDRGQVLRDFTMARRKGGTLSVLGVYGSTDAFLMGVLVNKG